MGFDLAGSTTDPPFITVGSPPKMPWARAFQRDPDRELVLLAHQPRTLLDAEPFGVGLQLSGHTHGGQMWPFNFVVGLQQPFVAGLHRRGNAQIYVSRGTGYWGPPMRLGAPAESPKSAGERPKDETPSAYRSIVRACTARPSARPVAPQNASNDRQVGDGQGNGPGGSPTDETDDDPGSYLLLRDEIDQIGRRRHLLVVDRRDDVPAAQTRPPRWGVMPDPAHQRAAAWIAPIVRRSPASRSRRSRTPTPMYGCKACPSFIKETATRRTRLIGTAYP